ncbi:meteorin-like protein [Lepisosteus oculatus]|uniref:meteorin-like protein n=1 Tax=Lepisosteus oculatus TaxID=7918 RepID=UPI0003EAA36C|nr:PREDICTED: meteorin-like protein isoform X1 [Lepisosteus oculatus]
MRAAVARLLAVALLCGTVCAQYSSDQCSWRGSGLTHETHARDVEQVYLRCAQGTLEWLYPTGALIVNLRPNTLTPAAQHLTVCIKPMKDSRGANIYLEKLGELKLLVREQEPSRVYCFGIEEGSLFIEATPQSDISRKITAFQYELLSQRSSADLRSMAAPCQPCSDSEVLLAVCTSDFAARGTIRGVEHEKDQDASLIAVSLSRLYQQKSRVFASAGGRARRWAGHVRTLLECGVKPGEGEFLFTGSIRFGEAWLGCAPRYKDFLRLYSEARQLGTNPCQVDTD